MRPFLLAGAIAALAAGPAFAQDQVQANPRGSDAPAVTSPDPQTASSPVAPAVPADPAYAAGAYKGALTPPPAEAMNKAYPLCSATVVDSCVNPREAGKSWGNRPLGYWPGHPASER